MKKSSLFLIIILCFGLKLFSQSSNDSIKNQILEARNSDITVISKGRTLLMDKLFVDGDMKSANEIIVYLTSAYNTADCIPFNEDEMIFICLITGNYRTIIDTVVGRRYEDGFGKIFNTNWIYTEPISDSLLFKSKKYLNRNQNVIYRNIELSDVSDKEKDFLKLLMYDKNCGRSFCCGEDPCNDTLDIQIDLFLKKYPRRDNLSAYADKQIRRVSSYPKPTDWGFGSSIGFGWSYPTSELSRYFSNGFSLDLGLNLSYKSVELLLNYNPMGSFNLKKELVLNNVSLEKEASMNYSIGRICLGYTVLDAEKVKILPFAGVSMNWISPALMGENYKKVKNAKINSIGYDIGVNISYKFLIERRGVFIIKQAAYMPVSLECRYSFLQFDKKNVLLGGDIYSFVLKVGYYARIERKP